MKRQTISVSSRKPAGNAEGGKRPTAGDECSRPRPREFFAMDGIMSRSPGWARATTSRGEGGRVPPFIEKLPIFFILIFWGPQILFGQTLQGLVDLAFEQNLGLKIAKLKIEESYIDVKKAKNDFIPDAELNLTQSKKTFLDEMQKSIPGLFSKNTLYSLSLIQEFPVLGKKQKLTLDVAKLTSQARQTDLERSKASLLREILKVFFQLLKEQELMKIHRQNIALLEKLMEVAKINQEVGLILKNDILRIEVQQANIHSDLVKSENSFQNLLIDLKNLVDPKGISNLQPILPRSLKFLGATIVAGEAEKLMLERDQELKLAQNDVEILRRTCRAAKLAYLPTLKVAGSYNHGKQVGPFHGTKDYSVMMSLTTSIYNSGDTRNEKRRVRKRLEMAELALEDLENTKTARLQKALSDYVEVGNRIRFAEKAFEQSLENMRMVMVRYQAGDAPVFELVDAQIILTNSAQTAINAYYDERIRLSEVFLLTDQRDRSKTLDESSIPIEIPNFLDLEETK